MNNMHSNEYKEELKTLIGKPVNGVIDRPLGSTHPKHKSIVYKVNYGYLLDFLSPDGEGQDVYVLGIDKPLETFEGIVIVVKDLH